MHISGKTSAVFSAAFAIVGLGIDTMVNLAPQAFSLNTQQAHLLFQVGEAITVLGIAGLIVTGLYAFFKSPPLLVRSPQPDMPINEAIDYIVNDSKADLKQPTPPYIADFGPAQGQRMIEMGVEHGDARLHVENALKTGALHIWGRRQIGDLSNQFEHSLREITKDYWDTMQLDFSNCFHFTDRYSQTARIPLTPKDTPKYTDLRVNTQQIRALWQPKPRLNLAYAKLMREPRIAYRRAGQRG